MQRWILAFSLVMMNWLVGCAHGYEALYRPPNPDSPKEVYIADIREEINTTWEDITRDKLTEYTQSGHQFKMKPYRELLDLVVTKDGKLVSVKVNKKSGLAPFDEANLEVFKQITNLPKPPPEIVSKDGLCRFVWEFVLAP